jgi:hypothetical protein
VQDGNYFRAKFFTSQVSDSRNPFAKRTWDEFYVYPRTLVPSATRSEEEETTVLQDSTTPPEESSKESF